MRFRIRFTDEATDDLRRLQGFLAEIDMRAAEKAIGVIHASLAVLETSPFSCRKALAGDPFLRELVIGFGRAGYVVLFEIEDSRTITVIGVRHQREADLL